MKKLLYPLLTMCVVAPLAVFAASSTPPPAKQPAKEKTAPPDLVDQVDDTDLYTVPLDTSEEEEDVEESQLEKLQKKITQKKPAPAPSTTGK